MRACAWLGCRRANVRNVKGGPRRKGRTQFQAFLALLKGRGKISICRTLRRHDTFDRECRRNIADEFSRRRERAGELRSNTSRTGAHRLLPWPKSVLSCAIGSCCRQSERAIRRRVVSGNYRNRPPETQTTSATTKAQTIAARDRNRLRSRAPPFDLISPNPGQPQSRRR